MGKPGELGSPERLKSFSILSDWYFTAVRLRTVSGEEQLAFVLTEVETLRKEFQQLKDQPVVTEGFFSSPFPSPIGCASTFSFRNWF